MSAYTPAPWTVVDNGFWDISIKAGGTVCHINSKGDWFPTSKDTLAGRSQNKMLTDARLIAAAPELLEACKTTLIALEMLGMAGSVVFRKVEEAIAKATGIA